MSTANTEAQIADVISEVTVDLSMTRLDLKPKSIKATQVTDGLGNEAWRLTIFLPKPIEDTWDVDAVFDVRQAAVAAFDSIALTAQLDLSGQTLAVVTTDEADLADVAPEELAPEDGNELGETDEELA